MNYPLYLQVFERSRMQYEKLTKDFFRQLGQRMSDKVRFFAWRRGNMLVAFSLCTVELSPNFGDGRTGQAAAVVGCRSVGLAMTSIPSLNVTPRTSFGNWL
jgi:hypothetical protein